METRVFGIIFCLAFASNVLSLNLDRLADDCLKDRMLHETENLKCESSKGVRVQRVQDVNQTFYCFKYEKKTGQKNNEFDVLSFDLHEDYDLKYTGANVISNDANNPKFKLHDIRLRPSYKGKFAFGSENAEFDIRSVSINGESQACQANNKQLWPRTDPHNEVEELLVETTTFRRQLSSRPAAVETTRRTTTRKSVDSDELLEVTTRSQNIKATTTDPPADYSCGLVKKIESFGNYVVLPSQPGKFPWTISIYRYVNDEEESYYKCGGTIIDGFTVLTSVNCLLEDGQLLETVDLQVYVAPFSLSARKPKAKMFNVAEFFTHESFNFHLKNNIAAVRLTREIEFNDYVQPICLPPKDFDVQSRIGKLAGFGKPSSLFAAKSDLLTEAEYHITSTHGQGFDAENTSGNNRISDIGSGLYVNETNRWVLAGVMSKRVQAPTVDAPNAIFSFTNVASYIDWLKAFGISLKHS